MRARDVFTPGSFPTVTFVGDHLVEKQQILRDALDSGNTVLALSGPSKSGKTVFVEKVVGKDNLIHVTGSGIDSPGKLWERVFDIIGTPRYRRITKEEELARIYRIPIPPQRDLPISWNIAPSQDVLAIRFRPKTGQRLSWNSIGVIAQAWERTSLEGPQMCQIVFIANATASIIPD